MKKIVLTLLILSLLFSNIVFAYSDEDLKDYPEFAQNYEFVKAFVGGNVKDIYPQVPVTRAEFVSYVVRFTGNGFVDIENFSDVSDTHKFYDDIATAKYYDFIVGDGNNKMHPDDIITATEAASICVRALCHLKETRLSMYASKVAERTDIMKGITVKLLNYDAAFRMLRNMANESMIVGVESGLMVEDGETFLKYYRDIDRIFGVIDANFYANITGGTVTSDKKISIDGALYFNLDTKKADKYLGYYVEAYCDEEDELLYFEPHRKNEEISILSSDITGYEDSVLYYELNGKEKKVKIDINANVLYNGTLCTPYGGEDFDIDNGKIRFLDNDGEGGYDCVFIEEYFPYMVEGTDSNGSIIGKFTGDILDTDSLADCIFTDAEGNGFDYKLLGAWDVIYVYSDKAGEIRKIIKGEQEIEGKINRVTSEDGKMSILLDDKLYNVSKSASRFNQNFVIGLETIFYIDPYGEVVAFNDDFQITKEKFGYMVKIWYEEDTDDVYVKMLDEHGKFVQFIIGNKLIIDGVSVKQGDVVDYFKLSEEIPFRTQPVRYRLSETGVLKMIDTATTVSGGLDDCLDMFYTGYSTDNGKKSVSSTLRYKGVPMIFGATISADANCKVIVANTDTNSAMTEDEYTVSNLSYIEDDKNYCIEAYKTDKKSHDATLILIYNDNGARRTLKDRTTGISVIDKVQKTINEDDEMTYRISYFSQWGSYSYIASDASVLDEITLGDEAYFPKRGDVVRIEVENDKIVVCELLYSYEKNEHTMSANPSGGINDVPRFQLAYVYEKSGSNIWTTNTELISGEKYKVTDDGEGTKISYESKNADKFSIIVYDTEEDKVMKGTSNDIIGFTNSKNTRCSRIFMGERYGNPNTMVIYK